METVDVARSGSWQNPNKGQGAEGRQGGRLQTGTMDPRSRVGRSKSLKGQQAWQCAVNNRHEAEDCRQSLEVVVLVAGGRGGGQRVAAGESTCLGVGSRQTVGSPEIQKRCTK